MCFFFFQYVVGYPSFVAHSCTINFCFLVSLSLHSAVDARMLINKNHSGCCWKKIKLHMKNDEWVVMNFHAERWGDRWCQRQTDKKTWTLVTDCSNIFHSLCLYRRTVVDRLIKISTQIIRCSFSFRMIWISETLMSSTQREHKYIQKCKDWFGHRKRKRTSWMECGQRTRMMSPQRWPYRKTHQNWYS